MKLPSTVTQAVMQLAIGQQMSRQDPKLGRSYFHIISQSSLTITFYDSINEGFYTKSQIKYMKLEYDQLHRCERRQLCSYSRNSQHFTKPELSLPCS
jgi:hypothetical protein